MALLLHLSKNLINKSNITSNITRNLSLSTSLRLKEIQSTKQNDELLISAAIVPSPREPYLFNAVIQNNKNLCPVCASGLDIKHTDVLILSQYVRSDGCMLPRRITGLCKKQQKRIGTMVTMAQKAGLMPNLAPAWSKKDPTRRYQWKKFNKYFDEDTIKC